MVRELDWLRYAKHLLVGISLWLVLGRPKQIRIRRSRVRFRSCRLLETWLGNAELPACNTFSQRVIALPSATGAQALQSLDLASSIQPTG